MTAVHSKLLVVMKKTNHILSSIMISMIILITYTILIKRAIQCTWTCVSLWYVSNVQCSLVSSAIHIIFTHLFLNAHNSLQTLYCHFALSTCTLIWWLLLKCSSDIYKVVVRRALWQLFKSISDILWYRDMCIMEHCLEQHKPYFKASVYYYPDLLQC